MSKLVAVLVVIRKLTYLKKLKLEIDVSEMLHSLRLEVNQM
ncbi:6447_t:CDS:1, partial [Cetraspora pellucida]